MAAFSDCNEENGPHGEHEFGNRAHPSKVLFQDELRLLKHGVRIRGSKRAFENHRYPGHYDCSRISISCSAMRKPAILRELVEDDMHSFNKPIQERLAGIVVRIRQLAFIKNLHAIYSPRRRAVLEEIG